MIPAIERYTSPRIAKSREFAESISADFFILSGKFGLLSPSEPIPWYDQLMSEDDVDEMSQRISKQLEIYRRVIFAIKPGDYVKPYRRCLELAARDRLSEFPVRV